MSSMESSLPKGWRRLKIRDVARIQTGFAFKSDWYVNDGVRLLRNANVSQRCVDWTDQVCLPEERYDEFDAFKMQENDIVLSLDRPLVAAGLKVAMVTPADLPALLVQRVARFQLSNEIDPSFLYAFLQSPLFINQISGHDQSLGVPHISPGQVGNVDIPLPSLPEQQRLAKIVKQQLNAVELAKTAAEKSLLTSQDLLPAILRQTFSGDACVLKPETRLGNIMAVRNDVVHPRDLPTGRAVFVGLEHIESNTGRCLGGVEVNKAELTGRKPEFSKGNIVYGYLRPYLNKVWVAEFDGLCSVDQYVYEVDQSVVDAAYIAFFMRSPLFFRRAPTSSTPGQLPRIRKEEVSSVCIDLPELTIQRTISRTLISQMTTIEDVMQFACRQFAAINALPASILRQVFSGQL